LLRLALNSTATIYPEYTVRSFYNRFKFLARFIFNWTSINRFVDRLSYLENTRINPLSPEKLGLLEWPYINNKWGIDERFDIVANHYETLAELPSALSQTDNSNALVLADLDAYCPGVRLIVDRPAWFIREGELVVNIFQEDLRVASIALVINKNQSEKIIIIGAIQGTHGGVSREDSLAINKKLTRQFKGLRPRSLLLEVLKMMANNLGVTNISAIADKNRHHRHPYFGGAKAKRFYTNYDEIWLEQKGVLDTTTEFYELPVTASRKQMSEIASRKRSMYRQRYEMLDEIEKLVQKTLGGV